MSEILKEKDVKHFIAFGTLLGIVRDGHFIGWDKDIDFGIFINDQFTWDDLESTLKSIGFKLAWQFKYNNKITEQTYRKKFLTIDFYEHSAEDDNTIAYSYYTKKDFDYDSRFQMHVVKFVLPKIEKTKGYIANGIEFPMPNNYEQYLEARYSANWRIPNPHWDPLSERGNTIQYLDDDEIAYYEEFR